MASPANPIFTSTHDQFSAEIRAFLANETAGQVKQDEVVPVDPATPIPSTTPVDGESPASTPTPAAATPSTPAVSTTPSTPALPAIPEDLDEINFEEAPPSDSAKSAEGAKPGESDAAKSDPAADPSAAPSTSTLTPDLVNKALADAGIGFTLEQLKDKDFAEAQLAAVLQTPRGKAMYTTWKEFRNLQEPPDSQDPTKGGLGFIPKVDEIREWREAYLSNQALRTDFEISPASFLLNLFGPIEVEDPETGGNKQIVTPSSRAVVEKMPEVFRQYAPQHYRTLSDKIIADHVRWITSDSYLSRLATDEDRENVKYAGQVFQSLFLKGKGVVPAAASAPPVDPSLKAEWDRIEAEKATLAAERTRNLRVQQQREMKEIATAQDAIIRNVQTSVMTGIKNAIRPIADYHRAIGEPEATTQALIDRIAGEITDLIHGNPEQGIKPLDFRTLQQYDRDLRLAARSRETQSKTPIRTYQRLAEMAIRRVVPPLLSQYAKRATGANAAVHQQAAVAAAQTAPVGAAAPVPASVVAPPANFLQRGEGESMQDYYKRAIQQQLTGAGAR